MLPRILLLCFIVGILRTGRSENIAASTENQDSVQHKISPTDSVTDLNLNKTQISNITASPINIEIKNVSDSFDPEPSLTSQSKETDSDIGEESQKNGLSTKSKSFSRNIGAISSPQPPQNPFNLNYRLFEEVSPSSFADNHRYIVLHPESRKILPRNGIPKDEGLYKYYAGFYWPPQYGDVSTYLTETDLRTISGSDSLSSVGGSLDLDGGGAGGGGGSFHSEADLISVKQPQGLNTVHGSVSGSYSGSAGAHGVTYATFIGAKDKHLDKGKLDAALRPSDATQLHPNVAISGEQQPNHSNLKPQTAKPQQGQNPQTSNLTEKNNKNVGHIYKPQNSNIHSTTLGGVLPENSRDQGIKKHVLPSNKDTDVNRTSVSNNKISEPFQSNVLPVISSSLSEQNHSDKQQSSHKHLFHHNAKPSASSSSVQGGFGAGGSVQAGAHYQSSSQALPQSSQTSTQGGFSASGNVQGGGYYQSSHQQNAQIYPALQQTTNNVQGGFGVSGGVSGSGQFQGSHNVNPQANAQSSQAGVGATGNIQGGGFYQSSQSSGHQTASNLQGGFGASGNVQGGGYYQTSQITGNQPSNQGLINQQVPNNQGSYGSTSSVQGGFGASGNVNGGAHYHGNQGIGQQNSIQAGYGASSSIQGTGYHQSSQGTGQQTSLSQGSFGASGNVQGGGYYQGTGLQANNVQGGLGAPDGFYQTSQQTIVNQGGFQSGVNPQGFGNNQVSQQPTLGQGGYGNLQGQHQQYPGNSFTSTNTGQGGFGVSGNIQGGGYYQQTQSSPHPGFSTSGNLQGGGFSQQTSTGTAVLSNNHVQGQFSSSGHAQGGGYNQHPPYYVQGPSSTTTQGGFGVGGTVQGGGYYQSQNTAFNNAQGSFTSSGNVQGSGQNQLLQTSNPPVMSSMAQGTFGVTGNVQGSGYHQQSQISSQPTATNVAQGGFSSSGNVQGGGSYQQPTYSPNVSSSNVGGGFSVGGNVQGSGYHSQSTSPGVSSSGNNQYHPSSLSPQPPSSSTTTGGFSASGSVQGSGYQYQSGTSATPTTQGGFGVSGNVQGGGFNQQVASPGQSQPSSTSQGSFSAGGSGFSGGGNVEGSGGYNSQSTSQENSSGNVLSNQYQQYPSSPQPPSSATTTGGFGISGNVQGSGYQYQSGASETPTNQGGFGVSGNVQGGGFNEQVASPGQSQPSSISQGGFSAGGSIQGSGQFQHQPNSANSADVSNSNVAQGGFGVSGNVQGSGFQQSQFSNSQSGQYNNPKPSPPSYGGPYSTSQGGGQYSQAPPYAANYAQGGFTTSGSIQGSGFNNNLHSPSQTTSVNNVQSGFGSSGSVQGSGFNQQHTSSDTSPPNNAQIGYGVSGSVQGSGYYQQTLEPHQQSVASNAQGKLEQSGGIHGSNSNYGTQPFSSNNVPPNPSLSGNIQSGGGFISYGNAQGGQYQAYGSTQGAGTYQGNAPYCDNHQSEIPQNMRYSNHGGQVHLRPSGHPVNKNVIIHHFDQTSSDVRPHNQPFINSQNPSSHHHKKLISIKPLTSNGHNIHLSYISPNTSPSGSSPLGNIKLESNYHQSAISSKVGDKNVIALQSQSSSGFGAAATSRSQGRKHVKLFKRHFALDDKDNVNEKNYLDTSSLHSLTEQNKSVMYNDQANLHSSINLPLMSQRMLSIQPVDRTIYDSSTPKEINFIREPDDNKIILSSANKDTSTLASFTYEPTSTEDSDELPTLPESSPEDMEFGSSSPVHTKVKFISSLRDSELYLSSIHICSPLSFNNDLLSVYN